MPRRETPFIAGQYYHFYNRGNNRQAIFFDHENYLFFLKGLKKYLCPHVEVIAYCLMPTHYHILGKVMERGEQDQASRRVSSAIQNFSISYTKAINKRYERVGALFQGQFRGKPVQTYHQLLHLCLYIHANPVKDGLAGSPGEWEYSNYREWMRRREGTLVNHGFITENYGSPAEYEKLIMEHIAARSLPEDLKEHLRGVER